MATAPSEALSRITQAASVSGGPEGGADGGYGGEGGGEGGSGGEGGTKGGSGGGVGGEGGEGGEGDGGGEGGGDTGGVLGGPGGEGGGLGGSGGSDGGGGDGHGQALPGPSQKGQFAQSPAPQPGTRQQVPYRSNEARQSPPASHDGKLLHLWQARRLHPSVPLQSNS